MPEYLEHIIVKTHCVGFHHWPDAPDEVAYLRASHRHLFKIEMALQVTHDDRDLEFHITKRRLHEEMKSMFAINEHGELMFGPMSCEMIAKALAKRFDAAQVIVWEDGEHGGMVTKI